MGDTLGKVSAVTTIASVVVAFIAVIVYTIIADVVLGYEVNQVKNNTVVNVVTTESNFSVPEDMAILFFEQGPYRMVELQDLERVQAEYTSVVDVLQSSEKYIFYDMIAAIAFGFLVVAGCGVLIGFILILVAVRFD